MNKNWPILVIEDDPDDQEILSEIFRDLDFKNQVIYFFQKVNKRWNTL